MSYYALSNVLHALVNLQAAVSVNPRSRQYVRREHRPYLETRFRLFDEYIITRRPQAFRDFIRLWPDEFEDLYQKINASRKEDLVLRLRSTPADDGPRVTWAPDVVDNEHLGRLKSNCCCIYTRPRVWDDPSTWEQDEAETEHCRGHTLPPPPPPPLHKKDDLKDDVADVNGSKSE